MPLGEGTYFLRSHTSSNSPIIVSHILGIACKTFGHQGACAGTNFIRKLHQTYTSSFDGSTAKFSKDVQDLAEIDAHSYAMATSLHYGLSDFGTGPLIKKSVRAFWTLNQRMPCAAPENDLPDDGFKKILEQLRTPRPNKRTAAEAELDVDEGNDDAGEGADEDDADWPEWARRIARQRSSSTAIGILSSGSLPLSRTGCSIGSLRMFGGTRASARRIIPCTTFSRASECPSQTEKKIQDRKRTSEPKRKNKNMATSCGGRAPRTLIKPADLK